MKKEKVPEMFAEEESEQEEQKHEELKEFKNWARIKLIKTEKDRTKLN